MVQAPADVWASAAAYEPYVGRWSRLVAREILTWLGVPPRATWLDVGCGTGALAETVVAMASAGRVLAVDASAAYVAYARASIADPRASFAVADARALPCATGCVDAVASGLVLNFVPGPELAVAEMTRVARPGGAVAAYVWDYAEGMQMMRLFWDAAVAEDPAAGALDEGRRFPLCHPDALTALWRRAGLREVACRPLQVPTSFASFDEYWAPFLGGQGPAPSYVTSLTDEGRSRLRERVRTLLPTAPDGTIALTARAWAVRGVRG